MQDGRGRGRLREALDGVRDVERLAGRAAAGRATPRELGALRDSFLRLPDVAEALSALAASTLPRGGRAAALADALDELDLLAELAAELAGALEERPPVTLADGGVIRQGYDAELDELRALRDGGRQYIASLQQRERERTGISSLKVGFNKVFGYYLEITNAHAARVPSDYERRQTLAGAERYVTPELKDYEARVLGAEERMAAREAELFGALRAAVGQAIARVQRTARVLARLDVWAALADRAVSGRYVRPQVHEGYDLVLRESRHPVIERMMAREQFIPNDARFTEAERVALVTGPNMAGKSTILRQIGLCVVLAQMGAFVPAADAAIGVVDRLFTRVGASDNLAQGQSTFMVEMSETSAILHNAGRRSLVLLDEIGRGTSTYDGVAIAWAVTEHLHDRVGLQDDVRHPLPRAHAAAGATPACSELQRRGAGDGGHRDFPASARAGRDRSLVRHSRGPARGLAGRSRPAGARDPGHARRRASDGAGCRPRRRARSGQLGLFVDALPPDPMVEELRLIDVNALTPLEALNRLADLKRRAEDRR